ncbi:MAG: YigZ family protein [Solirubrobacteraceae bacterium]|nr:YigZ family protein [Solirubrobacteraceae bacterium]
MSGAATTPGPPHLTLAPGRDVTFEHEDRRSRFVCTLRRVGDEAGARALLAELRSAHHAARHHCSAFVLGPRREVTRSNDDGEPSGTAGAPMLQALLGHAPAGGDGLPATDVAAVVVRWFGGVLLGAGGLVRAYSAATEGALAAATWVRREPRSLRRVEIPHAVAGRAEHELHGLDVVVRTTGYGAVGVGVEIAIPADDGAAEAVDGWARRHDLGVRDAGVEWVDVPLPAGP